MVLGTISEMVERRQEMDFCEYRPMAFRFLLGRKFSESCGIAVVYPLVLFVISLKL